MDVEAAEDAALGEEEQEYQELAKAAVKDTEAELDSLITLQRVAKSTTLDDCIESTLASKRAKTKEQEVLTAKLKKYRARKARVNLLLAGMTKEKMSDVAGSFIAKEKRRLERDK